MISREEIELMGYVYQDPRFPDATKYPNFGIIKVCVSKKSQGRDGEEVKTANWYECKSSNEYIAKILKNYVKDKCSVFIKGTPKAKAYLDKEGQPKASIEVLIKELQILTYPKQEAQPQDTVEVQGYVPFDDEIPF